MASAEVLKSYDLWCLIVQYQHGLTLEMAELLGLIATTVVVPHHYYVNYPTTLADYYEIPDRFGQLAYLKRNARFRGGISSCVLEMKNVLIDPPLPLHLSVIEDNVGHVKSWIAWKPHWFTQDSIALAAAAGSFNVIKELTSRPQAIIPRRALDLAAINGYLDIVKHLHFHPRCRGCTTLALDGAALNGHYDVVEFLCLNRSEGSTFAALTMAAEGGFLNIVRLLLAHRNESPGDFYMYLDNVYPGVHRKLQGTVYFLSQKLVIDNGAVDLDVYAMENFIRRCGLDALKYLREGVGLYDISCTTLNIAGQLGDQDMIKYIVRVVLEENGRSADLLALSDAPAETWIPMDNPNLNGLAISWSKCTAMDLASYFGHLESVQLLHSVGIKCCSTNAMDYACASGHLHILQWLHEHRCEGCSALAMVFAAANGHVNIIEWLHHVRGETLSIKALSTAAYHGQAQVVKYFVEHKESIHNDLDKGRQKAAHHPRFRNRTQIPNALRSRSIHNLPGSPAIISIHANAMDAAACMNRLDVLHLLGDSFLSADAITNAVLYGHVSCLDYLHKTYKMDCNTHAFISALEREHCLVAEYVVDHNLPLRPDPSHLDIRSMYEAIPKLNSIKLLEWVYDTFPQRLDASIEESMMLEAAMRGHFCILQWLSEVKQLPMTAEIKRGAQVHGKDKVVAYIDSLKTKL